MSAPAQVELLRRALPLVLLAMVLALSQFLDLPLARLFYRSGQGFFLDHTWPVQLLYRGTPWMTRAVGASLVAAIAWAAWTRRRRARNLAAYALLALALGPGLVVNDLLKEHWGRPRPEQLVEFGGQAQFRPALLPGGSCHHNCSFVSGHAAAGFFLITGAWIWPRRRWGWYAAGLAAGGLIGLARIAQGGHFLSDVLGALVVIWFTDELLYLGLQRWLQVPAAPISQSAEPVRPG